jgi:hypothetical protein
MGSKTAAAPINTHGGTPDPARIFFIFVNMRIV